VSSRTARATQRNPVSKKPKKKKKKKRKKERKKERQTDRSPWWTAGDDGVERWLSG
jgi:hypothetical protein